MSKSNAFEEAFLKLIFHGTAIADLAENDTTSPETNLYVSLHTASPTDISNQTTNETSYGSYARVAVTRNSSGWTWNGTGMHLTSTISFPSCTSGSATITHFGVGSAASGAGVLFYYGALTSSLSVSVGIVPKLGTGILITEN